jgi:hypothetical protein
MMVIRHLVLTFVSSRRVMSSCNGYNVKPAPARPCDGFGKSQRAKDLPDSCRIESQPTSLELLTFIAMACSPACGTPPCHNDHC